nr:hypothetical protein [Bdellovibrionales bacterium]
YQRSITDALFLNVSAGYSTTDVSKEYDDQTNASVKTDALHTYFLGFESVITPYPNLALAVSLDLRKTKDYSTETSGGNKTDFEKNKSKTVSLWTRYQF